MFSFCLSIVSNNFVGTKEFGRCVTTGNDGRRFVGIKFLKPFFNNILMRSNSRSLLSIKVSL